VAKRGKKTGILDWWQTVVDETKDLVDDTIDRIRDDDEDEGLHDEIKDLKKAVAELNAKLDLLATERLAK
jgi:gas vesicle protein